MASSIPLAERLRPTNFEDYIGQRHLIGEGAVLRKLIEKGMVPSMILWGTPDRKNYLSQYNCTSNRPSIFYFERY